MCVKALKTKLKVKMAVVMQQEQVVQEKDKTISQKDLKIAASEQVCIPVSVGLFCSLLGLF